MADIKRLPRIVPAGKGPQHPWYKERLRIEYQKSKKDKLCPRGGLDARGWRFLKPGLDDFRSGYPPTIGDQNSIRIPRGFSPARGNDTRKRLTKEQVCFSKEIPQRQARRRHVAEVEAALIQHRPALNPHLQECTPPEVGSDVPTLLDPKADDSTVKNPYLHLRGKENGSRDDRGVSGERSESPVLDEEIRRVTMQLRDCVVSSEEERDDPSEFTMFNPPACSFEMKPTSRIQKSPADLLQTRADEAEGEDGALSLRDRGRTPLDWPTGTEEPEISETQRNLDEELEQSYTAQAFKTFISSRGLREPEFLSACERTRRRPRLPEH